MGCGASASCPSGAAQPTRQAGALVSAEPRPEPDPERDERDDEPQDRWQDRRQDRQPGPGPGPGPGPLDSEPEPEPSTGCNARELEPESSWIQSGAALISHVPCQRKRFDLAVASAKAATWPPELQEVLRETQLRAARSRLLLGFMCNTRLAAVCPLLVPPAELLQIIARYFDHLSADALRDAMMAWIGDKTEEVEAYKAECAAMEEQAERCASEIAMFAATAKDDLAVAMPVVMAIETALDSLDRASLAGLKLADPADRVQLVMSAVLILVADSPEVPKDLSWAAATRMMVDCDAFLAKLRDCGQSFEVDEALTAAVEHRFLSDLIQIAEKDGTASSTSDVGGLLTTWVINVCKGARIRRIVDTKRAELSRANGELDRLNGELYQRRARQAEFDALLLGCAQAFDQVVQAVEPEPD
eukprot:COSAG06_NODE_516_length_14818_cov_18.077926_8_plen_417_part_00